MYILRFEDTSVRLQFFSRLTKYFNILGIKILKQIEWPGDCIFLLQGICVKIKWSYYTLKVYNYKDAGVIQGAGGAMRA